MYTGNSPTVHCEPFGRWVSNGTCRQRMWTNPPSTAKFYFPRSLSPGWAMCVRGVSCPSCVKFGFNLVDNATNFLAHMDIRFTYTKSPPHIISLNSLVDGQWLNETRFDDYFPFAQGQPFEVELRLLSLETVEMYANKTLTATYTSPPSFTNATYFTMSEADTCHLHFVDLWSGCGQ